MQCKGGQNSSNSNSIWNLFQFQLQQSQNSEFETEIGIGRWKTIRVGVGSKETSELPTLILINIINIFFIIISLIDNLVV